tara:strand:- start:12702 stop:13745 length:1044 start_codon:yes stop_codon:yes gene_type:complete
MIKVKILNPTLGRNEITFRPLIQNRNRLKDYSIDITDSDDYDFLFVGMHDFLDKKKTLEESIDYGLSSLSKISGDYFLFDGSDSTSLMGSYEVFSQSNAIYLFKNQLLKSRDLYKNKTAFNKWFFGSGSNLDLSYDISSEQWDRIKLSNINCGRTIFGTGLDPASIKWMEPKADRDIDICAIFQTYHDECRDHGVRNDIPYINHRKEVWDRLSNLENKYNIISKKLPFQEYIQKLSNSKVCISPFGQGELCFRDYEAMLTGTLLIRPDQSNVITSPNIFEEGETYLGCKLDWSDLEEKIEYALSNFNELNDKFTSNIRDKFMNEYTIDNFCMNYYNMFNKLETIQVT